MASTKIVLTPAFLKATQKKVEAGEGDGEIYTDLGQKNMELRIQARKASWVLRYKGKLKTIGYLFPTSDRPLTVLSEVKDLRAAVKSLIDLAPERVDVFLSAYHADPKHDIRAAYDRAEEMTRPKVEITTWTFRECLDNFLAKRSLPSAKRQLAQGTIDDIGQTFKAAEIQEVLDRHVVAIKRGDLETVRDTLETVSGPNKARKFVDYSRMVFDFSHAFHGGQSGLQHIDPWWKFLKSTTQTQERTRTPSLDEIGMTIALAEYFLDHRLPGRKERKKDSGRYDGKHGVRMNAFAGFLWVVLSAQRQTAALVLKARDLIPDPYREGWYIAVWGKGVLKGGRAFTLPIPPLMMSVLKPFRQQSNFHGVSPYAFPAEKSKDKAINRSVTLGILKRLGDRDDIEYKRRKAASESSVSGMYPAKPSILQENEVAYWVLHDTRRAITKVLDEAGIPGGATTVLAHKIDLDRRQFESDEAWEKQRSAQITERYYAAQRMKLKQEAMEIWVNAVVEAWARATTKRIVVAGRYVDDLYSYAVPALRAHAGNDVMAQGVPATAETRPYTA